MAIKIFGQPIRTGLGPKATAERREARAERQDDRRDDRNERISIRQGGRTERTETRQENRTGRTTVRQAGRSDRAEHTQASMQSFWENLPGTVEAVGDATTDIIGGVKGGGGAGGTPPIVPEQEEETPATDTIGGNIGGDGPKSPGYGAGGEKMGGNPVLYAAAAALAAKLFGLF